MKSKVWGNSLPSKAKKIVKTKCKNKKRFYILHE